jgi:pseudouridine kinase
MSLSAQKGDYHSMSLLASVFGTVFIDCKGFARDPYRPSGRNLGSIEFVHGGVGRNIAENLATLGMNVSFVSSVDTTALGKEVLERLQTNSIDTQFVALGEEQGMGMFLAVLDEHGSLAGSISQMPNLTYMQELIRDQGTSIVKQSSHIILELDLNEDISRAVVELAVQLGKPIYGIPGNLDVILKYRDLLDQLECFICNNFEADRLLGIDFTKLSIADKIKALIQFVDSTSMRSMVITLGELGSVYYDKQTGESGYQPVYPVTVIDSTGAGDAFFSGTVTGMIQSMPLNQAVILGTKVAGWTLESSENTCRDLAKKAAEDNLILAKT